MARAPDRRQTDRAGVATGHPPAGLCAVLGGGAGDETALGAAVLAMAEGLLGRSGDTPVCVLDAEGRAALARRGGGPMQREGGADGRFLVALDGRPRLDGERELGGPEATLEDRVARAVATWGIEATLARLDGAFALAIWDRRDRRMTLARDRFGQRPLYWGAGPDGGLVAGSSLRALAGYPGFKATLDREAVAAYLGCGWVPSPRCLIAGLRALPPGWLVDVTLGPGAVPTPDARPWFTLNAWLPEAPAILEDAAVADGADHLERTLLTALEAGLRGSAAPGIVLSPAPQSMLLAGLYGASSARALRSLSFSFGDPRLDAQDPTVEIASALGLDHRVEPLSAQALIDLVVDLPVLFDEPIADPAALATLYAATILRQGCDTILTGVGADLLLGIRPIHGEALRGRAGSPRSARRWLRFAPFGWLNTVSSQGRSLRLGDRWRAGLRETAAGSPRAWLEERRRLWRTVDRPTPEPPYGFLYPGRTPGPTEAPLAALILADAASELGDSTLPQIDRIAAAQRLGLATPFLDEGVARACLALSGRSLGQRSGGAALKRLLDRVLPTPLWSRARAWPMPVVGEWLRGPLRGWAEELIRSDALAHAAGLDMEPVRAAWTEHLTGQRDWGRELWAYLELAQWARRWGVA